MKPVLNLTAATLVVAALTAISGTAANAQLAYTLGAGGANLISFDIANPTVVLSEIDFSTLLNNDDQLQAIDFRSNGVLYGYNNNNDQVYQVNTTTGFLTAVGGSAIGTDQVTTSTGIGIDFNPTTGAGGTAAAFRIVTANAENRVFNVTTGTYTALAPGNPAGPQPLTFSTGGAAAALENAYDNNLIGVTASQQYALATNNNLSSLYTLNNNGGVLTLVGALGTRLNPGSVGFDIFTQAGGANFAYGVFQNEGNGNVSSLYSIDLTSGAAALINTVGIGRTGLASLAITPVVVPEAGTLPLVLGVFAALGAGVVVRRRK